MSLKSLNECRLIGCAARFGCAVLAGVVTLLSLQGLMAIAAAVPASAPAIVAITGSRDGVTQKRDGLLWRRVLPCRIDQSNRRTS